MAAWAWAGRRASSKADKKADKKADGKADGSSAVGLADTEFRMLELQGIRGGGSRSVGKMQCSPNNYW